MVKLKRIDLKAEAEGVWVEHPEGFAVKLRSSDSPRVHQRIAKEAAIATAQANERGVKLSDEDYNALMRRIFAEEVIVDWRDIDNGAYSIELAREFMADPELRYFQKWIEQQSGDVSRYMRRGVEEIAGN